MVSWFRIHLERKADTAKYRKGILPGNEVFPWLQRLKILIFLWKNGFAKSWKKTGRLKNYDGGRTVKMRDFSEKKGRIGFIDR